MILVEGFMLRQAECDLTLGSQSPFFTSRLLNLPGAFPVFHVGVAAFPSLSCVRRAFQHSHECAPSILNSSSCFVEPVSSTLPASIYRRLFSWALQCHGRG